MKIFKFVIKMSQTLNKRIYVKRIVSLEVPILLSI